MKIEENWIVYPAIAFVGPMGSGKSLRLKALVNKHLELGHRTHLFRYPDVANHQIYVEKIQEFTAEAARRIQMAVPENHRIHWHIALDESHCYLANFDLIAPRVMQFLWSLVNNKTLSEIEMSISLTSYSDYTYLQNFKKVFCP
jgi:hypothetical protein